MRHARLSNICCMDMSPTMIMRRFAVHLTNSCRSHCLMSHTNGLNTCEFQSAFQTLAVWKIFGWRCVLRYSNRKPGIKKEEAEETKWGFEKEMCTPYCIPSLAYPCGRCHLPGNPNLAPKRGTHSAFCRGPEMMAPGTPQHHLTYIYTTSEAFQKNETSSGHTSCGTHSPLNSGLCPRNWPEQTAFLVR